MRALIQRVKNASVQVEGNTVGKIDQGLLVFLGIHREDDPSDTTWLVNKILNVRCFSDEEGKMNLSVLDQGLEVLVVSQFTLYGNCLKGRRPDFFDAAKGPEAEAIYNKCVQEVQQKLGSVQTGSFGALMDVSLVNDGPVTLLIEK